MIRLVTALTLALGFCSSASATCTVLSGGKVYQDGAPEEGLTVVLDEGVIVGVGKSLRSLKLTPAKDDAPPAAVWGGRACAYIQLDGQHLVPGLVEAQSQIGLVEVGLEGETRNDSGGPDAIRAGMVVADAYNPRSTLVEINDSMG